MCGTASRTFAVLQLLALENTSMTQNGNYIERPLPESNLTGGQPEVEIADCDLSHDDALSIIRNLRVHNQKLESQISDLDAALAEASDSNLLYKSIIDLSPVPIAYAKMTGEFHCNPACEQHLLLTEEDGFKQGMSFFDMKPTWQDFDMDGKPIPLEDMPFARALQGETVIGSEFRTVRKDGTEKWEVVNSAPIYDDQGNLTAGFITFPDITMLKEAEHRLSESEREILSWIESSPMCTKKVDLDFNLQFMSSSGASALGLDNISEYYGKPYPLDFYPELFRTEMRKCLEKVVEKKINVTYEAPIEDASGKQMWFHSTLVPVFDDKQELDYIVIVSIETTERKLAERALRESEHLLNEAQRIAQVGSYCCDLGTGKVTWSEEQYRIFGYEPFEIVPTVSLVVEHIHPEDRPKFDEVNKALHSQNSPCDMEYRIVCKDGNTKTISTTSVHIYDESGTPLRKIGASQDITVRKQAESEMKMLTIAVENSQQELDEFFISSPAGLAIVDDQLRYSKINETLAIINGTSVEGHIGKTVQQLMPKLAPTIEPMFREVLDSGKEFLNLEVNGETPALPGIPRQWMVSYFPMREIDGSIKSVGIVVIDTTERMQAQERANAAIVIAEKATSTKSEFLANMSHEIRTPMTAILGFAESISHTVTGQENIESIEIIRRNGKHLLNIINDILDVSKIEAGKMDVELTPYNPCHMITEIVSLMEPKAHAMNLIFKTEYIGSIPESIKTNPTRLKQILINLIGNAIKFTEKGSIKLTIRHIKNGDSSFMQFDVLDTGIGMTDEQIGCLFQPFTQADGSTTRKFGGTGLGLTVSKRFAELLGGDITIEDSSVGSGTRFRATIPTGPVDGILMLEAPSSIKSLSNSCCKPTSGSSLAGLRVLFAEDGPDNQKLVSFVLKKAGAQVEIAENGKIALHAALDARDQDNPYDCILMDMQMPIMSGYEATAALREANYTGTIIALTAHAMAGDRDKCINAGCDDFANKPINRKELIGLIVEHTRKGSRAA